MNKANTAETRTEESVNFLQLLAAKRIQRKFVWQRRGACIRGAFPKFSDVDFVPFYLSAVNGNADQFLIPM